MTLTTKRVRMLPQINWGGGGGGWGRLSVSSILPQQYIFNILTYLLLGHRIIKQPNLTGSRLLAVIVSIYNLFINHYALEADNLDKNQISI